MSHLRVFRNFWEPFFKYENGVFNSEQEKESIIRVRMGYKNPSQGSAIGITRLAEKNSPLEITVCHHLASLMMPIDGPRDIFFYPILKLMMDSYIQLD